VLQRTTSSISEDPVFYDATGKRFKRIVAGALSLLVLLTGVVIWITLEQFSPIWQASENTNPDYPWQLIAANGGTLPVIGEGDLVSVKLVKRIGDKTYLADPYTGELFRQASDAEVKTIGTHTAVTVFYNYLANKQIALTFDDGPSAYTSQILDVLEEYNVPATFFVIGNNVLTTPNGQELLQRMTHDGDIIGGHTLTHVNFNEHGSMRDREEVIGTQHIIRQATGINTQIYRLPEGSEQNNALGLAINGQLGYGIQVGDDLDTEDWYYQMVQPDRPIPLPTLDTNGHVVVMHDGGGDRQQTVYLLEKFIKEAKAQGYTFTTVAPLLSRQYLPTKVSATINDYVSTFGLWLIANGWRQLFNSIMVSTTSLTLLLMVLSITVAAIRNMKQQKRINQGPKRLFPVSIIMPTYNEEKSLKSTLENLRAVLARYPRKSEVLVILNGCTDRTPEIAHAFAREWSQLRVLESAPGKANASNLGCLKAKYRIGVFIDADTKLTDQTLFHMVPYFSDKRVGCVAGHIKVGNSLKITNSKNFFGLLLVLFQKTEYLWGTCIDKVAMSPAVAPGAGSAFWLPRIKEVGGYSSRTFAEDFDITLRVRGRRGEERSKTIQDVHAVFLTEAPDTLRSLWGQRLRWGLGTLQACWMNRHMIFRPQYGWHGMFLLPYILMSFVMTAIFIPLVFVTLGMAIVSGNWQSLLLVVAFSSAVNIVTVFAAIGIAKESWVHLVIVPIYRFFDMLLRLCVLVVVTTQAMRGSAHRWFRPERRDNVTLSNALTA